jgi:hypothetical protein
MKRVLLLATTTGYQIRAFGEAAQKLGVRLVFGSDRCDQLEDPWWDGAVPVRFHDGRASVEALTTALSASPPDGILAVGDRPTVLAARMAQVFGLPGNPPAAAAASRNKLASRQAFRAANLPTPLFEAVRLDRDPHALAASLSYPSVIKPLALSGSRGVMRVNDAAAFVTAFERLRRLMQSPDVSADRDSAHDAALIESYVPGREYAVEGVLTRGTLVAFAIFDKPDPLDGPFFEETIYVTPSRAPQQVQAAIVEQVAAAAHALGLWHGPVHAECRVNSAGVFILEVAARPIGGLCASALRLVTANSADSGEAPMSLEEVLLRHAIGDDVTGVRREERASGVMMIPIPRRGVYRRVRGVEEARRIDGVSDIRITARADSTIVPLPEGRSYLGFIFATGTDAATVEQALREAHGRLEFVIEREVAMVEERAPGRRPQATERPSNL